LTETVNPKIFVKHKNLSKILFGSAAAIVISCAPQVSAVPVTFSGGSGTPLSFTLSEPVTYLITASVPFGGAPFFILQNVGSNIFPTSAPLLTGDITFTINGGPPISIGVITQAVAGVVTVNDLLFWAPDGPNTVNAIPGVSIGDTIVLSTGTLTTTSDVVAPAPPSGVFNTFITDGNGNLISAPSSVPDSLSTLWLGLPLAGMFAVAFRGCIRKNWCAVLPYTRRRSNLTKR
jgi:hypothetical protein